MQTGRLQLTSSRNRRLPFLVVLAILCAVTIIESVPDHEVDFYGHDFYTISGRRSTSETFSRSGTYILHVYSAQAPGCQGCRSIEIQADYKAPEGHVSAEFMNRILPGNTAVANLSMDSNVVIVMQPFILVGQNPSPETPPPRISTFGNLSSSNL